MDNMFKVYQNANKLPDTWDEIVAENRDGENFFLKKQILEQLEKLNPSGQLYHLSCENGVAFVSYQLKLNLLTFAKYHCINVPTNIIGLPISVAKKGYSLCKDNSIDAMVEYIKCLKGFYIILNTNDMFNLAQGNTLPTCKMDIHWHCFEQYLLSMRSHYCYRVKKALSRFSHIKVEELKDNNLFDKVMYELYEDVYERSSEKLEKQSINFFRQFPAKIIKFSICGETVAFVQLLENKNELIFLFGGFKYTMNKEYDLYMNMLLQIISYGINKKDIKCIDFGQTAEETKLKLGATQHPKYFYIHHSNLIMNGLLSKVVHRFSYKPYKIDHTVFKDLEGESNENPTSEVP